MNFDSAHPRSRGENCPSIRSRRLALGSSPLTRGKLKHLTLRQMVLRLIPAHAGKTPAPRSWKFSLSAHPRSRGENCVAVNSNSSLNGSSPLTRGKRSGSPSRVSTSGLIPAHAGKTRSRRAAAARCAGSSPLTRGKPFS